MVGIEHGPFQDDLARFGSAHQPDAIVAISAHCASANTFQIASGARPPLLYDFRRIPASAISTQVRRTRIADACRAHRTTLERCPTQPATRRHSRLGSRCLDSLATHVSRGADSDCRSVAARIDVACRVVSHWTNARGPDPRIMMFSTRVDFANRDRRPDDWAVAFDGWFAEAVEQRDLAALFDYARVAPFANEAVPTTEHFVLVFVALGASGDSDAIETFHRSFHHGNISMRSLAWNPRNEKPPSFLLDSPLPQATRPR